MQTIKLCNKDALEVLTLIERTIMKVKQQEQDCASLVLDFYDRLTSIKKSIDESCPELVERWDGLKKLLSECRDGTDLKMVETYKNACNSFGKWLDQDGKENLH